MRRRTLLAVAAVLALGSVGVPGPAAAAGVSDADLQRAATALEQARAEAGAAGRELAAARAEATRLRARLERVAGEVAAATARSEEVRAEALRRVGAMYVAAGSGPGADPSGTATALRRAYAAAVSPRDQEVISALAQAGADLDRWRRALQDGAREQAALHRRLEQEAAAAGAGLAAAEAEYTRVRTAWEAQAAQAARRAADSEDPGAPAGAHLHRWQRQPEDLARLPRQDRAPEPLGHLVPAVPRGNAVHAAAQGENGRSPLCHAGGQFW